MKPTFQSKPWLAVSESVNVLTTGPPPQPWVQPGATEMSTWNPERPPTVTDAGVVVTSPGSVVSQVASALAVLPIPGSGSCGQEVSCECAWMSEKALMASLAVPPTLASVYPLKPSLEFDQPAGTTYANRPWS